MGSPVRAGWKLHSAGNVQLGVAGNVQLGAEGSTSLGPDLGEAAVEQVQVLVYGTVTIQ